MKTLVIGLCILLLTACNNNHEETTTIIDSTAENNIPAPEPPKENYLVTDTSWGAITVNTDINDLKSIAGASNVKDERICGPECADSIDVTYLFKDTEKEIIVYWKKNAYHKLISFMESNQKNAPYHTVSGLKNGSTMEELLAQNGKKINFSGFGWDYGGSISSYNGGNLDKSNITFRMELDDENNTELLGDRSFDTDKPAVKKALSKIKVWQTLLSFEK